MKEKVYVVYLKDKGKIKKGEKGWMKLKDLQPHLEKDIVEVAEPPKSQKERGDDFEEVVSYGNDYLYHKVATQLEWKTWEGLVNASGNDLEDLKENSRSFFPEAVYNKMLKHLDRKKEKRESSKKGKGKEGGDEDLPVLERNFYETPTHLYEQVYKEGKNYFIKFDRKTQETEEVEEIKTENEIIHPRTGEEIEKGTITLPTGIQEYETDEKLDEEIKQHITTWLDIDQDYVRFAIWNIRFSWLYDRFNTLNYLRALGDTGSGKSRYLDTLGDLHYCPMKVSGALSPAPIFRIIDKWKGTLLIDEGDQQASDESDAFIKILNCGYEQGRNVMRCDQNDASKLQFFNVYCPKIITTRKRFDDKATEARCITKIMSETTRQDIPEILTKKYYQDVKSLRNKLLLYRLRNYDRVDPEAGMHIDLSHFEPRIRQITRGFVGLFAHNPKEVERFHTWLQEHQRKVREERADTFEGNLIQSVALLIVNNHTVITPTKIADMANQQFDNKYDVTNRSVSKVLRGFGLEFKRQKIDGKTENSLLIGDRFKPVVCNLFKRYVVDENVLDQLEQKGYGVTIVTVVTESRPNKKKHHFSRFRLKHRKPKNIVTHRNYRNNVTSVTIVTRKNMKKRRNSWHNKHPPVLKNSDNPERVEEQVGESPFDRVLKELEIQKVMGEEAFVQAMIAKGESKAVAERKLKEAKEQGVLASAGAGKVRLLK